MTQHWRIHSFMQVALYFNISQSLLIHYLYFTIKIFTILYTLKMQLAFNVYSALVRLKRSGYLSVEPRPIANHRQYLPSTCILCVLLDPFSLSFWLSGAQRLGGEEGSISGRPLNTEMSLPRAPRTGRTRSSPVRAPRSRETRGGARRGE